MPKKTTKTTKARVEKEEKAKSKVKEDVEEKKTKTKTKAKCPANVVTCPHFIVARFAISFADAMASHCL